MQAIGIALASAGYAAHLTGRINEAGYRTSAAYEAANGGIYACIAAIQAAERVVRGSQ